MDYDTDKIDDMVLALFCLTLHEEFGVRFRLLGSSKELHRTPFGTTQQFLYCFCRVE